MLESLKKRLSSKFYLIVTISFLFLLDGLALWVAIRLDYKKTFERTETILQKTVISLDERVKRSYKASEVILRNLAQRIQEKGMEQVISSREEWEQFRGFAEALPDSGSLWVLNSKADLLMDSTRYPSQPMNFKEREYYIPQRDGGIETYIGPMVKGKITHKYSFTISQRVTGKHGQFLGIVLAAIETDDFTNFLRILDIGEGSTIAVFRTDGALIFRQPMHDGLLGQNFKKLPLFTVLTDKSPSGIFEANMVDGVKRIIAYRKIGTLPLIATTSIPVNSVLNELRPRVKYYCLIAVIVFLILAGLAWLAYKSISREELTHRELLLAWEKLSRINDELELRVQKRTAALETANKELESFSYSVSHDLRAPLRHMSGFVELLQKRTEGYHDEKINHYTEIISASSKKMGLLIDDLLAFSRIGRSEMQMKVIDTNDIVKQVIQDHADEFNRREIEWKIGRLPDVYGDPSLLSLMLTNLIANAIKFTRPRARAIIEIDCNSEMNGECTMFVKDNGVGFDMKFESKLFGVFQRLHHEDEFEGIGIGLANVHRILSRHGGRIWAESTLGQGATFYFTLPTAKGEKA